jgi:hypothetical protein
MPYFDRPVRAQAVTKRNNYNVEGETQSILSEFPIKVGGDIYNLIIFDNKIEKIPSIDILFLLFNTTSAVRCYLSTSKSQSRYRPFRFEIFLMRAQSPSDPKRPDPTVFDRQLSIALQTIT